MVILTKFVLHVLQALFPASPSCPLSGWFAAADCSSGSSSRSRSSHNSSKIGRMPWTPSLPRRPRSGGEGGPDLGAPFPSPPRPDRLVLPFPLSRELVSRALEAQDQQTAAKGTPGAHLSESLPAGLMSPFSGFMSSLTPLK